MFQFDILDAAGAESIAVLYHYGVLNYLLRVLGLSAVLKAQTLRVLGT